MNKGLNKTSESTSLLGDAYLKHSSNFIPTINGVEIRDGIAPIILDLDFAVSSIAPVSIGGIKMIMYITTIGTIGAVIPEFKNKQYKIYRRNFQNVDLINLGDDLIITTSKIIDAGNYIYLLSNYKTWVIRKDGLCVIATDTTIIVDAFDATIIDADKENIELWRTGNYSSSIRQGTRMGYRIRNEFGGRGAMSQVTPVAKDSSYVVAGLDGQRQDVFATHNARNLSTDILFWGVRMSTYRVNGSVWDVDWQILAQDLETNIRLDDTKIGIVDDNYWTNCQVTASNTVVRLDHEYTQLITTIPTNQIAQNNGEWSSTGLIREGIDEYNTMIGISRNGQTILTCDSTVASKFNNGEMYYVPQIFNSFRKDTTGTLVPVRQDVNWAIKITSNALDFDDAFGNSGMSYMYPSTGVYSGVVILDPGTAEDPRDSKYFTIEIQGIGDNRDDLVGSFNYDASDIISDNKYISWTFMVPYFAKDASGLPCDLVAFTKPFLKTPTTSVDQDIICDVSIANNDYNFWQRRDGALSTGTGGVFCQPSLDIDDGGIFIYDKNYAVNFEVNGYEPLIVYYHGNTSTEEAKCDTKKYYDIYRIEDEMDFWLAGSRINVRNNLRTSGGTPTICNNWQSTEHTVEPIVLSKLSIVAHAVNKDYYTSLGDWNDIVFFNDRFFAVLNGVIKITNPMLEFNPQLSINVNGNVRKLITTMDGVVVLTDKEVLKINYKLEIQTFLDYPIRDAVAIGNQIIFINEDGSVNLSKYKRDGAETIGAQTSNLQLVVENISEILVDVTENWHVYDMIAHVGNVYFSTSAGVYVYYPNKNTWWRLDYPIESILKFISYGDKLITYGGDFDNTTWVDVELDWITGGVS